MLSSVRYVYVRFTVAPGLRAVTRRHGVKWVVHNFIFPILLPSTLPLCVCVWCVCVWLFVCLAVVAGMSWNVSQDLNETLLGTTCNFARCIKPNAAMQCGVYDNK